MRVLIVSVTAGYGHHATGKAIAECLESRGATVQSVDLFRYISRLLYKTVDKGYLLSTKYVPKSYSTVYSMLVKNDMLRSTVFNRLANDLLTRKFARYFNSFMPDVVVCTHVFSAMIMGDIKRKAKYSGAIIGILTDYTWHPFWEDADIDYIVTPDRLLEYSAVKRGIDPTKLLHTGIPIQRKFSSCVPPEQGRSDIGLNPAKNTFLLMAGSMGYGHITDLVLEIDSIREDFQMICVCGNNKKLLDRLCCYTPTHKLRLYGFTDNVDLLMDASDFIITKPGGLTTSEAISKSLPMILVNPIPGHEERNMEYLVNNGVALQVTKNFSVAEAVYSLLSNPSRINIMRESLELIRKPDAGERLTDIIYGLKNGQEDD